MSTHDAEIENDARRRSWPLTPWRIRRKLIVLHTMFSIGLALLLLFVVRPAVARVVLAAEREHCRTALASLENLPADSRPENIGHVRLV